MNKDKFKSFKESFNIRRLLFSVMALLIIFITISLSVGYYHLFRSAMLSQLNDNRIANLQLISQQIDSLATGAGTIAELLYQDEGIIGTLLSSTSDIGDSAQVKADIDSLYSEYHSAFQQAGLTFEIMCFSTNGFTYSTDSHTEKDFEQIQSYAWFTKQKILKETDYTVPNFLISHSGSESVTSSFAIVKNLYSVNRDYAGSIIVYIPEENLRSAYSSLYPPHTSRRVLLLDENSVVISSSSQNEIGQTPSDLSDYLFVRGDNDYSIYTAEDGTKYFSAKYYSSTTKWTLYEQIPLSIVTAPINSAIINALGIGLICFFISLAIIALMSSRISRPLRVICQNMQESIENQFAKLDTHSSLKEIKSIEASYNHLSDKISVLLEDIRASEKEINDAHFNFLKAQINPHFLYNTLFSIKCTIMMNDANRACEMLTILISILKSSVSSNDSETSLLDEAISLKQYVHLQNFRYNNRVQLNMDLPESLSSVSIPRFLIQPLVENVFLHAISPAQAVTELEIRFKDLGYNLLIEVCDTGIGFSQQELNGILQQKTVSNSVSSHIGLRNIQERIHLLYGKSYGLSVSNDSHFHTIIYILLPKHGGT